MTPHSTKHKASKSGNSLVEEDKTLDVARALLENQMGNSFLPVDLKKQTHLLTTLK